MKQNDTKLATNRSDLIEENELIVVQREDRKFKLASILDKTFKNKLIQQLLRFTAYTCFLLLILSLLNKNSPSTIYSIVQMEQKERSVFLRKQIPGLFPSLTHNWENLLNKWSIQLLRGSKGSQSFNQNSYQLEFKHFDEKQDVVYITKDNCNGHLIMNWEIYGSNIYFTDFVPPQSSMIIPNEPEDQQCIMQNGEVVQLLKYSSIWTISQENQKTALFLLIEQVNDKNEKNNFVLIANQYVKE